MITHYDDVVGETMVTIIRSAAASTPAVGELEAEYPLTVLRYELVDGSGGAGRFADARPKRVDYGRAGDDHRSGSWPTIILNMAAYW